MTEAACLPVSWLRLERYALGDVAEAERKQIADHLAGCARCRACADQIANDARELPPLPAAVAAATSRAPLPAPVPAHRRWRVGWRQAFAGAALAAAAVVLVARHGEPPALVRKSAGPRVIAVKGGEVTVELVRERDDSVAWEPTAFAPGDRFKLLLTCPPPLRLHVDLVVLQDDGPAFPGPPSVIACGNRVPVPPAFRITGAGHATVCAAVDPLAPPPRAALAAGDMPATGPHACLRLEPAR
jgi:hypothetical protein